MDESSAALGINSYPKSSRSASAQPRIRHKILPVHGRMMRRRAELVRLAQHRQRHGVQVGDPAVWAIVIADALVFARSGADFLTFSALAKDAGLAIGEEIAMTAIRRVTARAERKGSDYHPFHSNAVARMLDVTAEERWAVKIRTIGAVDETPEQHAARRKDELRDYERQRSRRRRAATGAIQRPIYEAASLSRTKPWAVLGMSRASWYRKGKPLPKNASAAAEFSAVSAVRRVRPLSYTSPLCGGRSGLSHGQGTARWTALSLEREIPPRPPSGATMPELPYRPGHPRAEGEAAPPEAGSEAHGPTIGATSSRAVAA